MPLEAFDNDELEPKPARQRSGLHVAQGGTYCRRHMALASRDHQLVLKQNRAIQCDFRRSGRSRCVSQNVRRLDLMFDEDREARSAAMQSKYAEDFKSVI